MTKQTYFARQFGKIYYQGTKDIGFGDKLSAFSNSFFQVFAYF